MDLHAISGVLAINCLTLELPVFLRYWESCACSDRFCWLRPDPESGRGAPAADQLTEPERWVLSQVTHGEEADLRKRFGPDQQKCRLSGAFLIKLITGGFKNSPVPCQGIQITNALIDGPIKVEYAELEPLLCLSHCILQDPVSFQKSHFKKDVCLNGSQFLAGANFQAHEG